MQIRYVTAVCSVMLFNFVAHAADIAPTTSPTGEKAQVKNTQSGPTIDIAASGGECDKPTSAPTSKCDWEKDGAVEYVWNYSGLQGTPVTGGTGATLKIKCDQEGIANVTVKAKQKWKEQGGQTQSTTSQASTAVKVKVQKPTSIDFAGSMTVADGGAFKWKVLDQESKPICNQSGMNITETVSPTLTIVYEDGSSRTPTFGTGSGPCIANTTTDASGILIDTPCGRPATEIAMESAQLQLTLVNTTKWTPHRYDAVIGPDGVNYQVNKTQNQVVVQASHVSGTITQNGVPIGKVYGASTTSVSPQ